MPFSTYYGPNTVVSEDCLWISDGTRRICLTYTYVPFTGMLLYAATIFKTFQNGEVCEPTQQQLLDNGKTTAVRFAKRPVVLTIDTMLEYTEILKFIRHEMCHGYGCKGIRNLGNDFGVRYSESDYGSESSDNTFLSNESACSANIDIDIDHEGLLSRKLRRVRYISSASVENYNGVKMSIIREFFIAFKANKKTGELIYGAAISHRPESFGQITDEELIDGHFKTAVCRLEKKPVGMIVESEFCHQLSSKTAHREDVMYQILDKIISRTSGNYLIKGNINYQGA